MKCPAVITPGLLPGKALLFLIAWTYSFSLAVPGYFRIFWFEFKPAVRSIPTDTFPVFRMLTMFDLSGVTA